MFFQEELGYQRNIFSPRRQRRQFDRQRVKNHCQIAAEATGSAAAALVAWLGQLDGESTSFDITQGVEMGRPSKIEASVTVDDGISTAVTIGGRAIKVMEGRLAI